MNEPTPAKYADYTFTKLLKKVRNASTSSATASTSLATASTSSATADNAVATDANTANN